MRFGGQARGIDPSLPGLVWFEPFGQRTVGLQCGDLRCGIEPDVRDLDFPCTREVGDVEEETLATRAHEECAMDSKADDPAVSEKGTERFEDRFEDVEDHASGDSSGIDDNSRSRD